MSYMASEIPSTALTVTTSSSTSTGLRRYHIHFREWFGSQLGEIGDFSSKNHYFAQQEEDIISIQNIS